MCVDSLMDSSAGGAEARFSCDAQEGDGGGGVYAYICPGLGEDCFSHQATSDSNLLTIIIAPECSGGKKVRKLQAQTIITNNYAG